MSLTWRSADKVLQPITDFDFIVYFREVSIEHLQWFRQQTDDAYSFGHLFLSHLGHTFVLMMRPVIPKFVIPTDLEFRTALGTSILPSVLFAHVLWCFDLKTKF